MNGVPDERDLTGAWVCLSRTDLNSKTDEIYYYQIIGLPVFINPSDSEPVATVASIFETAAHEILVTRKPDGKDVLFPFVDHVVTLDLQEGKVIIPDYQDYDLE